MQVTKDNFEIQKPPQYNSDKRKIKNSKFTFHEVDNAKIIKEIKRLSKNKASKNSDTPIIIIYENADTFAGLLTESLKGAIKTYNFPNY